MNFSVRYPTHRLDEVMAMPMKRPVTMVPTNTPPSVFAPRAGMDATMSTASTGSSDGGNRLRAARLWSRCRRKRQHSGNVLAGENAGLGRDLAAHFLHHRTGGATNRAHAKRAEQERQQATNEQADDDERILQRESAGSCRWDCRPRAIPARRSQRARAPPVPPEAIGVALGYSLHRVANRIHLSVILLLPSASRS